jgi:hypothetical protein
VNDVFSAGKSSGRTMSAVPPRHAARLQMESYEHGKSAAGLKAPTYVGCCGWFYWKWRELFYPNDLPTGEWFRHYAKRFDTVEFSASFLWVESPSRFLVFFLVVFRLA